MKKNRLFSLLLTLSLVCAMLAPFSTASANSVDDYVVNAKSAILVDTTYGEILYEHNAMSGPTPPASPRS